MPSLLLILALPFYVTAFVFKQTNTGYEFKFKLKSNLKAISADDVAQGNLDVSLYF